MEDREWRKAYYAALQAKRLDPYCAEKLDGWMRDAGLRLQVKKCAWPFTKQQIINVPVIVAEDPSWAEPWEGKTKTLMEEAARTTNVQGMYKIFRVTVGQGAVRTCDE